MTDQHEPNLDLDEIEDFARGIAKMWPPASSRLLRLASHYRRLRADYEAQIQYMQAVFAQHPEKKPK